MNVALVFIVIFVLLFGLAFVTKRRFGVLGLALAAGAMLSELWAAKLTPIVANAGLAVEQPPLQTLVASGLVLLPAILLLVSGPSYHDMPMRLVSATAFAVLAAVLLIEPIGQALVLMDQNKQVYQALVDNQVYIVTAGLVFAIFDVLTTHTGKHPRTKH